MNYQDAIDWLYATQQFGIKLGLDAPRRLLRDTLSFPRPGTRVIHVAGTNGKGSTCAIIDALARASGTRTGLFTSPHLVDYRERIRVNGDEISEKTTAAYLTEIRNLVAEWEHHPTFFEITLALAMKYFREQRCELIILETGMGGRLDATTAVPADVAVITPIALDHTQWLGDTLEKVAAEKAGIIVAGKPVISASQPPAAHAVIEQYANELQSPIEFITSPLTGYYINLPGSHQRENAALALAAAHTISLPLNADIVREALPSVTWLGRFERLSTPHHPLPIVLDAAHNPHAAAALVATWKEEFPHQKATLVFGAVEGKSPRHVLALLAPIASHIHLVPTNSPRSLSPEELAAALPENAPPHSCHPDLTTLLDPTNPTLHSSPEEVVLICGSIFLIGQARAILTGNTTRSSSQ